MSRASDKFSQPDDGIEVVARGTDLAGLALARGMIQAGADPLLVVPQVAAMLVAIDDGAEGEPRELAAPSPLHRAAGALEPRLAVAVRYAFAKGRAAIKGKRGAGVAAIAANAVAEALAEVLRPSLLAGLKAGGEAATKTLRTAEDFRAAKGPKTEVKFTFDAVSESAVSWADRHAAELVAQISDTTREDINNAIAELLETGDWTEATDEILAAVGDDARATLIARHESMNSVSQGQREAWDQAVEQGYLTGDEKRTWIVTPDDKLCPICEGLDGKFASLDGSYTGDDGEEYDGPPAHVACRCTEGIA